MKKYFSNNISAASIFGSLTSSGLTFGSAFTLVIAVLPHVASAQPVSDFPSLMGKIYSILASLVPIIVALTLIVFLWGIFQLVRSNSEDAREDAIKVITFGVVALFVMVSVWGLVAILNNTVFGGSQLYIPQLR